MPGLYAFFAAQAGFSFIGLVVSSIAESFLPLEIGAAIAPAIFFGPSAIAMTRAKLFSWREKKAKEKLRKEIPGFERNRALLAPRGNNIEVTVTEVPVTKPLSLGSGQVTSEPQGRLHVMSYEELVSLKPEVDLSKPESILTFGGNLQSQVGSLVGEFSLRVQLLMNDKSLEIIHSAAKEIIPELKNPPGFQRVRALQMLREPLESRLNNIISYLTATETLLKELETTSSKLSEFHRYAMETISASQNQGLSAMVRDFSETNLKGLEISKATATQVAAVIAAGKSQWTGEIELIQQMIHSLLIPQNFTSAATLEKADLPILQKILEYSAQKSNGK
jgi:hypothetical protein